MNGLQIIDLKEATFMDKVLRRERRENAFVEINNLIACVPILEIDKESIEICLQKYDISNENARSRLLNLYSKVLQHFVQDLNISQIQNIELEHLQDILNLTEKEVNTVKSSVIYPIYETFIKSVVSDGNLSEKQKKQLENLSLSLRITKKVARDLYRIEAHRYLDSILRKSIANGMLSTEEEEELETIAKNLQVTLKFTESANKNLERHRYLWQLYTGNLPKLKTPIHLDKDEECSAIVNSEHFEIAKIYETVKYSGYGRLSGIKSTGFQTGRVRTNELIGKSMRQLDQGTLYFTNKRLILKGINRIFSFPLLSIMGGTFYSNGMLIEHIHGRDQFFKFTGDIEVLKLIFDSLMTNSRK